jgi:hypothetical protein
MLLFSAELTQNPFASTHSLDANPFDDPPTQSSSSFPSTTKDSRLEQLSQREQDLERREQELNKKAEHIRTHGRNNWPFSMYHHLSRLTTPLIEGACTSVSSHIPLHLRRNSRSITPVDYTTLPAMAGSAWDVAHQHGCMYLHLAGRIQ